MIACAREGRVLTTWLAEPPLDDPSSADKNTGTRGKPHLPLDVKLIIEDVLTFSNPQSRSEIGKIVDAQFMRVARGLDYLSRVDGEQPREPSTQAAKSTFKNSTSCS